MSLHREYATEDILHFAKGSTEAGKPHLTTNSLQEFNGRLHEDTESGLAWDMRQSPYPVPFLWTTTTKLQPIIADVQTDGIHNKLGGTPDYIHSALTYPRLASFRLVNVGSGIPTTGAVTYGEEVDAGKVLPYLEVDFAGGFTADLLVTVPSDYTGYRSGGNGLRWTHKVTTVDAGFNPTVAIELMDPATAIPFGTPKRSTRTPAVADGTYATLQITEATIGAAFTAGDLHMIRLEATSSAPGATNTIRMGFLEVDWE